MVTIVEINEKLNDVLEGYKDLKNRYDSLQSVYENIRTEYETLQSENEELKKKYEELRQYASDLEQKYSGCITATYTPEQPQEKQLKRKKDVEFKRGEIVFARDSINVRWKPAVYLGKAGYNWLVLYIGQSTPSKVRFTAKIDDPHSY
jgi:predicted nuclease with TOPRIM domain